MPRAWSAFAVPVASPAESWSLSARVRCLATDIVPPRPDPSLVEPDSCVPVGRAAEPWRRVWPVVLCAVRCRLLSVREWSGEGSRRVRSDSTDERKRTAEPGQSPVNVSSSGRLITRQPQSMPVGQMDWNGSPQSVWVWTEMPAPSQCEWEGWTEMASPVNVSERNGLKWQPQSKWVGGVDWNGSPQSVWEELPEMADPVWFSALQGCIRLKFLVGRFKKDS